MEMPQLPRDAITIWQAGVSAVDSERLVRKVIHNNGQSLLICGREFPLAELNRVVVVGAGKAGAGMAAAVEQAVGRQILEMKLSGWINVPADCVRPLEQIHLHPARPAGVNEPTQAGADGSAQILEMISKLSQRDVCIVLLSGGGSALLPAPVPGITLGDKQAVTRLLMHAGATINELNCVRKQLSLVKGGNLARACAAGNTITLIISDVIGDPLDVIASGPTVADSSTAADALEILQRYAENFDAVPTSVVAHLTEASEDRSAVKPIPENVTNHVIGNNTVALGAAKAKAEELGYQVYSLGSGNQGEARAVGRDLADLGRRIRDAGEPVTPPACVLSGGEPVVHLVKTDEPRKGGRNQELVVAGLENLWEDGMAGIALLSGGTDGEDGPTDAAGGFVDADVLGRAKSQGLAPEEFLAINNSYPFLERAGGLLKTGPTHTNVMDLRVLLVDARRRGE